MNNSVFVVEAEYQSVIDGSKYWGPIGNPLRGPSPYAIYSNKDDAENCITLINDRKMQYEVMIMGNDWPLRFRVTEQQAGPR